MMLIVPGRVGTSSPELGVPTAFSDISAYEIICETQETKVGYNPELSYGSHIFVFPSIEELCKKFMVDILSLLC